MQLNNKLSATNNLTIFHFLRKVSPQDGSCQKLQNDVYAEKNCGRNFTANTTL